MLNNVLWTNIITKGKPKSTDSHVEVKP